MPYLATEDTEDTEKTKGDKEIGEIRGSDPDPGPSNIGNKIGKIIGKKYCCIALTSYI
jgi:hypothetical protein